MSSSLGRTMLTMIDTPRVMVIIMAPKKHTNFPFTTLFFRK